MPSTASSEILFEDNFDGYSDDPDQHGWIRAHTQVTVEEGSACYGGSGRCMKITYINEGTGQYTLSRNINYKEGYYKFQFKRTGHGDCGGCKFFKIRAIESSLNYANLTIQMDYGSGNIDQIDHGCGTSLTNDQGCGGRLSVETQWGDNGTVVTAGETYSFPDEKWHSFQVYVKLNTNGNSDGAYTFWIDGVKNREVIDVKIRNDANPEAFTLIDFASYNAYDGCSANEYELYYDNFVFSDEYIYSGSPPLPPSNLKIIK